MEETESLVDVITATQDTGVTVVVVLDVRSGKTWAVCFRISSVGILQQSCICRLIYERRYSVGAKHDAGTTSS